MKLKSKVKKADKIVEKIVVLNSGGFDSVVLAHEVSFLNPNAIIYELFFNYGQLNYESEKRCSKSCADKLQHKWKEISLPMFDWSNSILSGGFDKSQYIPLRNLVFLSYALSFAKGISARTVYCAFINPLGEYFEDTSPMFVEKVNALSETFGIKVEAPFVTYTKGVLLKSLARAFGITGDDVYSCNFGNEPCGECTDCEAIKEIFDDIDGYIADDILTDNNFAVTEQVVEAIKKAKVTNAKVYINNDCSFNCAHCFIGKSKLVDEPLTIDEWCSLFEEMHQYGITSIDFFGKEPLYDDKFCVLMQKCKDLGMAVSVITNGVTIPKYIDVLERLKPTVTLSVESLDVSPVYRTTGSFIISNIKLLVSKNIPVNVSIDLSNSNTSNVVSTIKKLHKAGVSSVYIKPIRPYGDSEDALMKDLIPTDSVLKVVDDMISLSLKDDIDITMSFAMMDLHRMFKDNPTKFNKVLGYAINNRLDVVDGVKFEFELFCHRFMNNVAVTPDGYVLGCASEYCTDYSKFNSVRTYPFKECVTLGKESLTLSNYKGVGCYFCKKYRKKNAKVFEVG